MDPSLFPSGLQFDMPAQKPKGGMFGGGPGKFGIGQAIIAALNGYLASQPGGAGAVGRANLDAFMQAAMDRRRQAQEEAQYQRKRQDDRGDFVFEQDYKAAHPAPISNDTVNDYQFIAQTLGDDAAKQFLQTKTNPIVVTPYGPMPYSSAIPQVPKAPVGKLVPYNEGGPSLGGSGGFRY
jgi:hypothetical protein